VTNKGFGRRRVTSAIQGMTQVEVARVIGVSVVTAKRRLNRGLQLLTASLEDLRPPDGEPEAS
jgi:DNA-directed RNA polymerase specialized sigma24 family protein